LTEKAIQVGVDVGGTFTDFVVAHPQQGWLRLKTPTTRPDPSVGILQGLRQLGVDSGIVSHGTTAATNVALERKGPSTALVTTAGFSDILALGRGQRLDLYALQAPERPSLVPPELCFEIQERLDARGEVLIPLQPTEVNELARTLADRGVEAVAVCLLFAYLNPVHELLIGELFAQHGLTVTLSHKVDPQPKEYERASTTVMQAYVSPSLQGYLERLQANLQQTDLWVVRSSGSVCRPSEAVQKAVGCLLSGPAAGLMGAWRVTSRLGFKRIITLDVGGTSSDVALCDGDLPFLEESSVGGIPYRCPQVDIHTVGAGGGSIAFVNSAGLLQVGPQSAGSHPGPAAYGKGGPPTLSDALLVLGRLPLELAGGNLRLDRQASLKALGRLSQALELPILEVAAAVVSLAEQNMAQALRLISLERGYDPRKFVLVAYGGGGGSHAAALADLLGIKKVIVPAQPGLLCAQGAMLAPWQDEERRSWTQVLDPALRLQVEKWQQEAQHRLKHSGLPPKGLMRLNYLWELRYQGQGSSLWLKSGPQLERRFHNLHRRRFGTMRPEQPLELVSTLARARVDRAQASENPMAPASPAAGQPSNFITAHWGLPPLELQVQRYKGFPPPVPLPGGGRPGFPPPPVPQWVEGPARIETMDGTLWVAPNWRVGRAPEGSLIMESLACEEEHEEYPENNNAV